MAALTLSTYSTPAVSQAHRRPTLAPGSSVASTLPGGRTPGDGLVAAIAVRSSVAIARADVASALPDGRTGGDGLGLRFAVSRQLRPGYGAPAFLGDRWLRFGDNSGVWDTSSGS